jgi:mono/diheme cytochrome c family protein
MYRGIIQDAPWLSEGPRKFIRESGLAGVNQRGRIWRIRHRDHAPTRAPQMSRDTTAELLRHLENPNGWWRDTAQLQIILRPDRDAVAPMLADLARYHDHPLTRLHALWTLEGLAKIDAPLVIAALADRDPRMRAAAARLGEPLLEQEETTVFAALTAAAKIERVPEVAKQFVLSLAFSPRPDAIGAMDELIERHVAHEGVFLAACTVFWKKPSPYLERIRSGDALLAIEDPTQRAEVAARWTQGFAQWQRQIDLPADMLPEQRAVLTKGAETYFESCVSCHGADARGVAVPGRDHLIAPALAGSARVRGPASGLVPVLINGLVGPIEGRTYEGAMMVPAATLGITRDDRLAEVISFIRYAWGNEASPVTKENVAAFRRMHGARATPWTDSELHKLVDR